MASWILVPCLVKLRSDFNAIAPDRDKSSDGSVGDLAHQSSRSDHNPDETGNVPIRDTDLVNEVHALDVDVDLRTPGLSMEPVVQFLLARCRSGAEKRLRYIIFNRRIWEASNGWREKRYTGASPHDHHAHFSSSYDTKLEASTASWHLEDIPMALTADDKKWITGEIKREVGNAFGDLVLKLSAVPTAVWAHDVGKATGRGTYTARGALLDAASDADAVTKQVPPIGKAVDELPAKVAAAITNPKTT